jgi:hypothetical protein
MDQLIPSLTIIALVDGASLTPLAVVPLRHVLQACLRDLRRDDFVLRLAPPVAPASDFTANAAHGRNQPAPRAGRYLRHQSRDPTEVESCPESSCACS